MRNAVGEPNEPAWSAAARGGVERVTFRILGEVESTRYTRHEQNDQGCDADPFHPTAPVAQFIGPSSVAGLRLEPALRQQRLDAGIAAAEITVQCCDIARPSA